jgi:hypothetical protein
MGALNAVCAKLALSKRVKLNMTRSKMRARSNDAPRRSLYLKDVWLIAAPLNDARSSRALE